MKSMRKQWPSARRPKEDEALDCLVKTILSHVSVKNLNFRLKVLPSSNTFSPSSFVLIQED